LLSDLHNPPSYGYIYAGLERRLTRRTCSDINNLIMDYLITEGYPSAAQKFAIEANIPPNTDFESINERVEIRNSIHRGDLQTAIEKINELNPQVR
jgi:glucose-induced degradation protein 8